MLVSTIDGGLHLLEIDKSNNKLTKLWQHDFGSIMQTSLNDIKVIKNTIKINLIPIFKKIILKLYEDDVQIGILASLDGRLYKYNSKIDSDSSSSSFKENSKDIKFQIESLEEFPFDLESVLSNSFRVNNDIGFIGSVNILTLGINYQNGKV